MESKSPLDQPMEPSSRNRRRIPDPLGKLSELLQKIGIRGKEVVRIIKTRGWEVCDPKALQEHKLYYVPGGRAKGEQAVQGVDYFVGEGELFAFILKNGGIRFLLPGKGSTQTKEDSDSDFELLDEPPQTEPAQRIMDTAANNESNMRSLEPASEAPIPQEAKRKRRKNSRLEGGQRRKLNQQKTKFDDYRRNLATQKARQPYLTVT
ncbi:hypothetical protein V7S43_008525 [Phytophthora oleae]|uniref:Uncharacterized protein n=1 Tax=Phytophthora oleae TaxID=2107226 RepID=A0ABD3FMN9_9STRA